MGLCIKGKYTKQRLSYSYSRLHYTTRYLALLYCGMPEYLDSNNETNSMLLYMSPHILHDYSKFTNIGKYIQAVQLSGFMFPNILLHSDCEGNYTKNGKPCSTSEWITGNTKALLTELKMLIDEPEFQVEKYKDELQYTKEFYDVVKDELENGKGVIEFC